MSLLMELDLVTVQEDTEDNPIQQDYDGLCLTVEYTWALVIQLINERKRLINTDNEAIIEYLNFNQKIEEARQTAMTAEQTIEQMEDDNPELERPEFLMIPPKDSPLRKLKVRPRKKG